VSETASNPDPLLPLAEEFALDYLYWAYYWASERYDGY
jgi:hypothetical protein